MQIDKEKLETGTTTIGIAFKGGVVLASETKSTLGLLVASKTATKIHQIDDKIALTTAGGSGDTQNLVRILKAEINIYKLTRQSDFTVKSAITLLSNILQNNRYYPYIAMMIVGGVDKSGSHIYSVDMVGGAERDNYTATGSGSPIAYGVLEDGWRDSMTRDETVHLAVRAIKSARERDIFSGGKFIRVAVVDENGFSMIDDKKVRQYIDEK